MIWSQWGPHLPVPLSVLVAALVHVSVGQDAPADAVPLSCIVPFALVTLSSNKQASGQPDRDSNLRSVPCALLLLTASLLSSSFRSSEPENDMLYSFEVESNGASEPGLYNCARAYVACPSPWQQLGHALLRMPGLSDFRREEACFWFLREFLPNTQEKNTTLILQLIFLFLPQIHDDLFIFIV